MHTWCSGFLLGRVDESVPCAIPMRDGTDHWPCPGKAGIEAFAKEDAKRRNASWFGNGHRMAQKMITFALVAYAF